MIGSRHIRWAVWGFFLGAAPLIVGFPSIEGAALPKASVPRLEGSVVVDGNLEEGVWSKALVLGPFVENGRGGGTADRTYVRVFVDDEALYLAWSIYDRDIQATLVERDSRFWEEEVVEFFLAIEALDRYFELQWNPLGGVFDATISNRLDPGGKSQGIDGDWSFTAVNMKSAVSVDGTVSNAEDIDRIWTVETVIPFKDLEIERPKAGVQWRANFYRFNRGGGVGVEKQSWSPTLDGSFHQPSRFGILTFE